MKKSTSLWNTKATNLIWHQEIEINLSFVSTNCLVVYRIEQFEIENWLYNDRYSTSDGIHLSSDFCQKQRNLICYFSFSSIWRISWYFCLPLSTCRNMQDRRKDDLYLYEEAKKYNNNSIDWVSLCKSSFFFSTIILNLKDDETKEKHILHIRV